MVRRPREDAPGMWHHVFNRGLSHRTVFETRALARFFLSRVALAVRRGEIELHAFVLMTTHFHFLLRSPMGELSVALQRIESEFAVRFNRQRGRDGALFRGRFGSRPVKSEPYKQTLVRYIDQNPVVAGLVTRAEDYPHGSAARFLSGSVPPWLTRSWIDQDLRYWTDRGVDWRSAYRSAYSDRALTRDELFVLERCMESKSPARACDDLLSSAPESVRRRFTLDTLNADGTAPAAATVGPDAVAHALDEARAENRDWALRHASTNAWKIAETALLVTMCGMSLSEVARRSGCSKSTAKRTHDRHLELLTQDPRYRSRFADIAVRCLVYFQAANARG